MSLIGHLNHAAMVVWPGRAFLRSLIDAASTAKELDHWVHLNAADRSDLAWWHTFLQAWNEISLLPSQAPSIFITSDASGNWGCGAVHSNAWFQLEWPQSWVEVSIAPKELVPVIVAVGLWGVQWPGATICCLCDNAALVAAINKGSARDPSLVRLLRILAWFSAMLNLSVRAQHLPGTENVSADALSRGNLPLFFAHNLQASPMPAIIPRELRELALNRSLLWTSANWTGLFSTLTAALCLPHTRPIRFGIWEPYPLREDKLCRFVVFLASEGLKHRTIKLYLSGLRFANIFQDYGNPFKSEALPRLEYVLGGIKRREALTGLPRKPRLPITIEVMLWAASCIGFFGFLHSG